VRKFLVYFSDTKEEREVLCCLILPSRELKFDTANEYRIILMYSRFCNYARFLQQFGYRYWWTGEPYFYNANFWVLREFSDHCEDISSDNWPTFFSSELICIRRGLRRTQLSRYGGTDSTMYSTCLVQYKLEPA